MSKFTREGDTVEREEERREGGRLGGRSLDIAPLYTPIYYYRKGSRILVVDLSKEAFDSRRATWDLILKVLDTSL
jgi:hypothetical protein